VRGSQFTPSRLAFQASIAAIVPDAEAAGLRLLAGRSPQARRMMIFGTARVFAIDVDESAGIAVVWTTTKLLPGTRLMECHCQYEFRAGQWHSLGSVPTAVESGFPGQRPSCRERGSAAILTPGAGGGGRAMDGRFTSYETYRVAQEVHALDIDGRISPVPPHGYCIVNWKSERYDGIASRPVIRVMGSTGDVLTELRSGEYLDTASLASTRD